MDTAQPVPTNMPANNTTEVASKTKSGKNGNAKPTTGEDVEEAVVMQCRICGDTASGVHYGVHSCEGCKGFFRRTLTKGLEYSCKNGGGCAIVKSYRNSCQFCRMRKCEQMGMRYEGSRLGRIPKANRPSRKDKVTLDQVKKLSDLDKLVVTIHEANRKTLRSLAEFNDRGDQEYRSVTTNEEFAHVFTAKLPSIENLVREYFESIEPLKSLEGIDHRALVGEAFLEVFVARTADSIIADDEQIIIPTLRLKSTKRCWDSMETEGDFLRLLHGFARKFQGLNLLDVERSIFATMLLVCADRQSVQGLVNEVKSDSETDSNGECNYENPLQELEVKIASALLCQIRLNHNNHSQLIPRVITCLGDLRHLSSVFWEKMTPSSTALPQKNSGPAMIATNALNEMAQKHNKDPLLHHLQNPRISAFRQIKEERRDHSANDLTRQSKFSLPTPSSPIVPTWHHPAVAASSLISSKQIPPTSIPKAPSHPAAILPDSLAKPIPLPPHTAPKSITDRMSLLSVHNVNGHDMQSQPTSAAESSSPRSRLASISPPSKHWSPDSGTSSPISDHATATPPSSSSPVAIPKSEPYCACSDCVTQQFKKNHFRAIDLDSGCEGSPPRNKLADFVGRFSSTFDSPPEHDPVHFHDHQQKQPRLSPDANAKTGTSDDATKLPKLTQQSPQRTITNVDYPLNTYLPPPPPPFPLSYFPTPLSSGYFPTPLRSHDTPTLPYPYSLHPSYLYSHANYTPASPYVAPVTAQSAKPETAEETPSSSTHRQPLDDSATVNDAHNEYKQTPTKAAELPVKATILFRPYLPDPTPSSPVVKDEERKATATKKRPASPFVAQLTADCERESDGSPSTPPTLPLRAFSPAEADFSLPQAKRPIIRNQKDRRRLYLQEQAAKDQH